MVEKGPRIRLSTETKKDIGEILSLFGSAGIIAGFCFAVDGVWNSKPEIAALGVGILLGGVALGHEGTKLEIKHNPALRYLLKR